jgi:hypothetical protein
VFEKLTDEPLEAAMRSAQIRFSLLSLLFGLTCASAAGAQQVMSLEELERLRNTSTTITVTDRNGREFRGTVADASETRLSLWMSGAIHRFDVGDVRSVRVRRDDGWLDGALLGAAVGGGLSALMFLDNECRDDPACYAAVAVYAGIGGLAGLGIDALLHRDDVVYTAPPAGAQRLTVAPLLARGRNGVRLTIVF